MPEPKRALRTESKKGYRSGFALTEGELRRIHEVLVQQIVKTRVGSDFRSTYEVKYRNGSVAHLSSLDELLSEENYGSAGTLRLRMEISDREEDLSNMIGIQFCNRAEDEERYFHSVGFVVLGEDRDWVFVTSSQIDERVAKIKLLALGQFFGRGTSTPAFFALTVLPMLAALSALVFTQVQHAHKAVGQLDLLEGARKAGTIKDPSEIAIQVGRIVLGREEMAFSELIWPSASIIGVILLLMVSGACYSYFQPPYNFLWGDYVPAYEKRRSRGKFLLIAVLLALVIGVVANLISKKLGI